VVAAPLIPLFMALVGWRAKAASEAQMLELGRMNAFLLDRLRGIATLRALAAIPHTARRLRGNAESLRVQTMRVLKIAFLSSAVLELFSALGVALTAVYTGFHVLGQLNFGAWGQRLSLAEGLFILLLAPAFFEPLRDLSAAWHDRAAGEAARDALAALDGVGERLPGADTAGGAAFNTAPNATLATRNLSVARDDDAPVLRFPDLDIAAGERVALWGASGSGKTLLLSLMAGLATPRTGRISIDDTVLTDATANALRPAIGWMGQKPHVFAGSVRANVSLERKGVNLQQVNDAVANAGLTLANGASACRSLGEGGIGLSGGEGVRLALARLGAANDTTLMLVDEPTAHLDNATALRVIDALLRIAGPRTLIVATHDPRVAARMDRIVHLGVDDAALSHAASTDAASGNAALRNANLRNAASSNAASLADAWGDAA
jgi:ATP-binding cassette subfamily C protein CydD